MNEKIKLEEWNLDFWTKKILIKMFVSKDQSVIFIPIYNETANPY